MPFLVSNVSEALKIKDFCLTDVDRDASEAVRYNVTVNCYLAVDCIPGTGQFTPYFAVPNSFLPFGSLMKSTCIDILFCG